MLKKTNQKKNKYVKEHTLHVGMYDCMRSESKSESGNQLSGILRKSNKQTCILVCLLMYVCMRSESESAWRSSLPQLKGVRAISACVSARVRAGTISLISLLCLFVCRWTPWQAHRDKHTHTHATLKTHANTCQVRIENPSFVLKEGNTITHTHKHTHTAVTRRRIRKTRALT